MNETEDRLREAHTLITESERMAALEAATALRRAADCLEAAAAARQAPKEER